MAYTLVYVIFYGNYNYFVNRTPPSSGIPPNLVLSRKGTIADMEYLV